MALRLIEDFFEVGANPENVSGTGWNAVGGRVAGSGAIGESGTAAWISLPGQGWSSGLSEAYLGFALRAGHNMNNVNILSAYSDNNSVPQLTLSMDSLNRLVLYRGLASSGGTLISTSPTPFPILAQWRSINVYFKVDDTTGRAVVKIDGTTVMDYTGDTRNGGTSTLIDGIRVQLSNNNGNGFCDFVLCDQTGTINNTYPGDIACIRRVPDSNGTYSEFVGSDGNQLDNYQLVDETPSNATDYTYATDPGKKDSYGIQDLPAATISVLGVRAVAKTAKSGAGTAGMSVMLRENSVETFSSSVPLSTSFTWQADTVREVKPSDSEEWEISDVNNLEIGVRSESS